MNRVETERRGNIEESNSSGLLSSGGSNSIEVEEWLSVIPTEKDTPNTSGEVEEWLPIFPSPEIQSNPETKPDNYITQARKHLESFGDAYKDFIDILTLINEEPFSKFIEEENSIAFQKIFEIKSPNAPKEILDLIRSNLNEYKDLFYEMVGTFELLKYTNFWERKAESISIKLLQAKNLSINEIYNKIQGVDLYGSIDIEYIDKRLDEQLNSENLSERSRVFLRRYIDTFRKTSKFYLFLKESRENKIDIAQLGNFLNEQAQRIKEGRKDPETGKYVVHFGIHKNHGRILYFDNPKEALLEIYKMKLFLEGEDGRISFVSEKSLEFAVDMVRDYANVESAIITYTLWKTVKNIINMPFTKGRIEELQGHLSDLEKYYRGINKISDADEIAKTLSTIDSLKDKPAELKRFVLEIENRPFYKRIFKAIGIKEVTGDYRIIGGLIKFLESDAGLSPEKQYEIIKKISDFFKGEIRLGNPFFGNNIKKIYDLLVAEGIFDKNIFTRDDFKNLISGKENRQVASLIEKFDDYFTKATFLSEAERLRLQKEFGYLRYLNKNKFEEAIKQYIYGFKLDDLTNPRLDILYTIRTHPGIPENKRVSLEKSINGIKFDENFNTKVYDLLKVNVPEILGNTSSLDDILNLRLIQQDFIFGKSLDELKQQIRTELKTNKTNVEGLQRLEKYINSIKYGGNRGLIIFNASLILEGKPIVDSIDLKTSRDLLVSLGLESKEINTKRFLEQILNNYSGVVEGMESAIFRKTSLNYIHRLVVEILLAGENIKAENIKSLIDDINSGKAIVIDSGAKITNMVDFEEWMMRNVTNLSDSGANSKLLGQRIRTLPELEIKLRSINGELEELLGGILRRGNMPDGILRQAAKLIKGLF